jgi:hypothetical protein
LSLLLPLQILEITELQATIACLRDQQKAQPDSMTGENDMEHWIEERNGDTMVISQNVDGNFAQSIDEQMVLQENKSQRNPKLVNETSILQSQVLQQVLIILCFL